MSGKITPVLIIAIVVLAACNNSSGPGRSSGYKPVDLNIPTKVGDQSQQPGQSQTNTNTVLPVVSPGTITQPATNVSAAGLNPEHGKPGHRCDIAVGAPLNSPASATPTITASNPTTNNPVTITPSQPLDIQKTLSTPVMAPATSKAGLNPEHGKPGHRCDIAVGAPLDSKPIATPGVTTTPTMNSPVNTTTSIPQVTPILPAGATPVKTDGVTAAGMNPEHGKPGHRCDIAVGAPLDSKPTVAVEKKN